jgi:hypothetical protein
MIFSHFSLYSALVMCVHLCMHACMHALMYSYFLPLLFILPSYHAPNTHFYITIAKPPMKYLVFPSVGFLHNPVCDFSLFLCY